MVGGLFSVVAPAAFSVESYAGPPANCLKGGKGDVSADMFIEFFVGESLIIDLRYLLYDKYKKKMFTKIFTGSQTPMSDGEKIDILFFSSSDKQVGY